MYLYIKYHRFAYLFITNLWPLNFCPQHVCCCLTFQIQHMYRCARVQGLDTSEGLLLFGKEHFYVIDGYTMTVSREIRDIDTLPPKYVQVFFPCCKDIDELFHMFNSGLQILKACHSLKKTMTSFFWRLQWELVLHGMMSCCCYRMRRDFVEILNISHKM